MNTRDIQDELRYYAGFIFAHHKICARYQPDESGTTVEYTDTDGQKFNILEVCKDDERYEDMLDTMLVSKMAKAKVTERYARTLKRLRQKGFCHERNVVELRRAFSARKPYALNAATLWNTVMLVGENENIHITDEMWYECFDRLLIVKDWKLLKEQDRSIIHFCIDNMYLIYMFMDDVLAQAVTEMRFNDAMKNLCNEKHLFTKDECRQLTQKTCEKLTEEINDFYAEQRKEFEAGKAAIEFLSSEGERLAKELSALRRENKALEKECYQLRKENGTLGEELARAAAAGYDDTPTPLPEPEDLPEDVVEDVEDTEVPNIDDLPTLPQTGILFVGGHPNFIKKLKECYPNWSYIVSKNAPERMKQYDKLTMCFIYSEHMGHPLYNGVINELRSCDTPYSYIRGTNLERVIREMRLDYAEAYKNNKEDETHD